MRLQLAAPRQGDVARSTNTASLLLEVVLVLSGVESWKRFVGPSDATAITVRLLSHLLTSLPLYTMLAALLLEVVSPEPPSASPDQAPIMVPGSVPSAEALVTTLTVRIIGAGGH
jgi:hypothetical protein